MQEDLEEELDDESKEFGDDQQHKDIMEKKFSAVSSLQESVEKAPKSRV